MKRSIKARTTGRLKRQIKREIIPFYGKKGMGWIKNPKKAAYNKIYNKTSFSIWDILKHNSNNTKKVLLNPLNEVSTNKGNKQMKSKKGIIIAGVVALIVIIATISGSVRDAKENSNMQETTIAARIVTDFSEENREKTSEDTTGASATESTTITTTKATATEMTYILNISSMKFHRPNCRGVKEMKDKNKKEFTGERQELIEKGYSACGMCHP